MPELTPAQLALHIDRVRNGMAMATQREIRESALALADHVEASERIIAEAETRLRTVAKAFLGRRHWTSFREHRIHQHLIKPLR